MDDLERQPITDAVLISTQIQPVTEGHALVLVAHAEVTGANLGINTHSGGVEQPASSGNAGDGCTEISAESALSIDADIPENLIIHADTSVGIGRVNVAPHGGDMDISCAQVRHDRQMRLRVNQITGVQTASQQVTVDGTAGA
ncbi:hypothetical protein HAP94_25735, partial [Acidithiobacillus ferrivorans]|nr:hypothetical protein [Acidithiobacillus ferrivorans]